MENGDAEEATLSQTAEIGTPSDAQRPTAKPSSPFLSCQETNEPVSNRQGNFARHDGNGQKTEVHEEEAPAQELAEDEVTPIWRAQTFPLPPRPGRVNRGLVPTGRMPERKPPMVSSMIRPPRSYITSRYGRRHQAGLQASINLRDNDIPSLDELLSEYGPKAPPRLGSLVEAEKRRLLGEAADPAMWEGPWLPQLGEDMQDWVEMEEDYTNYTLPTTPHVNSWLTAIEGRAVGCHYQ